MANTTTANYGWVKPEVGADTDAWGTHLNADLDDIDAKVAALLPKAGGTMTGALAGAVGALAAPGYAFAGDANTGAYWIGADHWALVAGGTAALDLTASSVLVPVALNVSGAASLNGAVTLGDAAGDAITVSGTASFAQRVTFAAATAGGASLVVTPTGTAPSAPANGDVWSTSAGFFHRVGGVTKAVMYTDGSTSGNAGTATALASPRTISLSGDVTATTGGFDGTAAVSGAATIAAGAVSLAKMANLAAFSIIGNNTGSASTPLALSAAQAKALLAIASADVSGLGSAAGANTGTSGANVPLLNAANTWAAAQTLSAGFTANGACAATAGLDLGGVLASMSATEAGYMGLPQNNQSNDYTLVAGDRGKGIFFTASKTCTIPAAASVNFPIGTVISISADAGASVSIAIASDTLRLVPTNATGTRTLAGPGTAFIEKKKPTEWWIRGDCA